MSVNVVTFVNRLRKLFYGFLGMWLMLASVSCKHQLHRNDELYLADSLLGVARALEGHSVDSSWALVQSAHGIYKRQHSGVGQGKALLVIGRLESVRGDKNKAMSHFGEAAQWSQNVNDSLTYCQALIEQGKMLYEWGRYDSCLIFFSRAQDLAILLGDASLECQTQYFFGKYCHTTSRYELEKSYHENALRLANASGRADLVTDVLLSYSKYFLYQGITQRALDMCSQAYDLALQGDDLLLLADACNHLGGIYLVMGQPELALDYHRAALQMRQGMGNTDGLAKSYNNIGEIYLTLGKYPEALEQFGLSLDLCTRINYAKGSVKALNNISEVFMASKKFDEAIFLLNSSLRLAEQSGYGTGQAETHGLLGKMYLASQKWALAINHYRLSNTFTDSVKLVDLRIKNLYGLYHCHLSMADTSSALSYLQNASGLERTRMKSDFTRQLAETHILFETEKRKREYDALKRDFEMGRQVYKRNRALLWLSFLALALLAAVSVLAYAKLKAKRRAHFVQVSLNRELELAIGEKDKLMSIIAHELRNPLYWFQNLSESLSLKYHSMPPQMLEKSLQSLDESAKNAFHLMDNLLYWSRSRLNRIKPVYGTHRFAQLIGQVLATSSSIIGQKQLRVSVNCPDDLVMRVDKDLMTCVLRNLLSNAVKFTPEFGQITINVGAEGKKIVCRVDDSGLGIPIELRTMLFESDRGISSEGLMHEKGAGFGLRLCKEFVEMHGGTIAVGLPTLGGGSIEFSLPLGVADF